MSTNNIKSHQFRSDSISGDEGAGELSVRVSREVRIVLSGRRVELLDGRELATTQLAGQDQAAGAA